MTVKKKAKSARAAKKAKTAGKPAGKKAVASFTGYKGEHREGSNKGKAHEWFDTIGEEKAFPKIVALGIKEGTARSWFSEWRQ
jgi:hypothetical protein